MVVPSSEPLDAPGVDELVDLLRLVDPKIGLAQDAVAKNGWAVMAEDALQIVGDPDIVLIDLREKGVTGELWAVHGGGFYHPVKFAGAPPKLPGHLHWFYWESYTTWMSGFALLTVSYLWNARAYLIDPARMDWAPPAAIAASATAPISPTDPPP